MNDKEVLGVLYRFIDAGGGQADQITPKKFRERVEIIEDPERPDEIVFTLERHEAVLGESYLHGEPMHCFRTYWPKYAFDPQNPGLQRIGDAKPSVLDIDYDSAAEHSLYMEFTLEPLSDGKWRYRESWSEQEGAVANVDELAKVAVEMADVADLENELCLFGEYCDEAEASQHAAELRKAMREFARKHAQEVWEDAQEGRV